MASRQKLNELVTLIDEVDELAQQASNDTLRKVIPILKKTYKRLSRGQESIDVNEPEYEDDLTSKESANPDEVELEELSRKELKNIAKGYKINYLGSSKKVTDRIRKFERLYKKYNKKSLKALEKKADKRDLEYEYGKVKNDDRKKDIVIMVLAHDDMGEDAQN